MALFKTKFNLNRMGLLVVRGNMGTNHIDGIHVSSLDFVEVEWELHDDPTAKVSGMERTSSGELRPKSVELRD